MPQLSPHYLELVTDAALKSYWYKKSFRAFLRRCNVPENLLSTWNADEEGKREFLDRLLPQLETRGDVGIRTVNTMADSLMQQETFPDLNTVEDSARKKALAKQAVFDLKAFVQRQQQEARGERENKQKREQAKAIRESAIARLETLESLSSRLTDLSKNIGTQAGGYGFEKWFYDLLDFFEIPCRRPYKVDGRQIDGSITLIGTTYLVELKFTKDQADAPDVDIFRSKIRSKADNTMGIMLAMSGYSSIAISEASREQTPILLLDSNHIFLLFNRTISFHNLIDRVRRHCSQTGRAYLPTSELGN
jgi:hypothetical protein